MTQQNRKRGGENKLIQDGELMYQRMCDLFPINRSITGRGVRETLRYIKEIIPELRIHRIKSGKKAFDWKVPDEWNLNEAYIADKNGTKIIDIKDNNLHVIGYSDSIDCWLNKKVLERHLHTIPDYPEAIPYITSYYSNKWGFCVSQEQKDKLTDENYYVRINTTKGKGYLNYADLIIKGKSREEVLISTYVCHPSMANNELSGPMVATRLAEVLSKQQNHYTYRFVFIPETIGSLVYLSKNLSKLKRKTKAGYVLTCIGDNNAYSFMGSKYGNTLSDKAALIVINEEYIDAKIYTWKDRGSDERQFLTNRLPIASLMRSKYGEYREYHTSKDNLEFVSEQGLQGGLAYAISVINRLKKRSPLQ